MGRAEGACAARCQLWIDIPVLRTRGRGGASRTRARRVARQVTNTQQCYFMGIRTATQGFGGSRVWVPVFVCFQSTHFPGLVLLGSFSTIFTRTQYTWPSIWEPALASKPTHHPHRGPPRRASDTFIHSSKCHCRGHTPNTHVESSQSRVTQRAPSPVVAPTVAPDAFPDLRQEAKSPTPRRRELSPELAALLAPNFNPHLRGAAGKCTMVSANHIYRRYQPRLKARKCPAHEGTTAEPHPYFLSGARIP